MDKRCETCNWWVKPDSCSVVRAAGAGGYIGPKVVLPVVGRCDNTDLGKMITYRDDGTDCAGYKQQVKGR